ncbi:hypothetical protein GGR52DRAFT_478890 [Hypoxylon sp. FL1284]|nr:hypothetical protein GGR52DRAFT_478890 [Hypoxylon sp. FL1284]
MLATLTTGLALLALTDATPVRRTALDRSKAFHLQVQLSNSTKDLDPPVRGAFLDTYHAGAAMNLAGVGAHLDTEQYAPYYVSATADGAGTQVQSDLNTTYPWGVLVQQPDEFDPAYVQEHAVNVNVGGGTAGVSIKMQGSGKDATPALTGPAPGTFGVCRRYISYATRVLSVVRYFYDGEPMPSGCVPVSFVPFCAELQDFPPDSQYNHDAVKEVDCVVAPTPRM